MAIYDVFNGDADGICGLLQLRLADPKASTLVTGVKRDIQLLKQINAKPGDEITVLDISLDKNRAAMQECLEANAHVRYFDHHNPGDIPSHPNLDIHINTDSNTCTSLIVNKTLQNKFALWAITGAYGDNMQKSAETLCKEVNVSSAQGEQLKSLGTYINYNGYGPSEDLLHFRPAELYQRLYPFANPLDFIQENKTVFDKLENGYHSDLATAKQLTPYRQQTGSAVYMLPNEAWAKRVSGVFGNRLASDAPPCAHAIITELGDSHYLVSVRAPLDNKTGADEICMQFPTGGGRKGAAGINKLPADQLDEFINVFQKHYS
ncbi:MAG: hypothetical protein KUG76_02390 [Gammaproteobacteria bacterium]|nr:hypothetical protein [Gammaproteobacteria bacterium]